MSANLYAPARTVPEWEPHVLAWVADLLAAGKSESTVAGYAYHVRALALAHEHAADPWSLTPAMLAAWFEAQRWSQGTRKRTLVSLRAFYAWATANGHTERSPLAGLPVTSPRTPGPNRATVPPRWAEPAAAWATHLRAGGRAESTVRARTLWLIRLAETFADPWNVTADDLALFLSRTDWSPETKRSARATAVTFYKWAVRAGRLETSPAEHLESVRVPRALPRPATDDAVRAALEGANDRTRLMLMLAGLAGLRRAEVAAVHTDDLGMPGTLRVRGKGGHDRLLPLHPDLGHALTAEVHRRRIGSEPGTGWTTAGSLPGWLFPSERGGHLTPSTVGRIITDALPAGWTPHTLRHRFATQAYGAGRDLRAVQELLGHARPETTARYAAVPDHSLMAAVRGANFGQW